MKMRIWMFICAALLACPGLFAQADKPQAQPAKPPATSTLKVKWAQATPLPVGVFDAAGSLVADRFYVVTGGLWQSGMANDSVQVFDVPANKWAVPCKLATPRFNHTQVPLDASRILVAGGQLTKQVAKGTPIFAAEIVDLQTGTCQALPDAPDAHPMRAPSACLMGDVAVIIGADRVYRYHRITNAWLPTIKLHESRAFSAAAVLDDHRILIVGGEGRDTMELLDLTKAQSTLLDPRLPMKIDDLQAVTLHDGRVWISGGQDAKTGDTTEKTWFLDIDKDQAKPDAKLTDGPVLGIKKGMADHRLVTALPYIYLIGGESQLAGADTELNQVRAFDVKTFAIRPVTSLPQPCDDALAFEFSGRIYVVGGYFMGPATFGGVRLPRASADVFWCQAPEQ
jgi:hypothetical protein